jgi:hypothetical protein
VDIAGNLIQSAPKLSDYISATGELVSYNSIEGGSGFIHLKRDNAGALVGDAKGVFNKTVSHDTSNNLYSLNYNISLNTSSNRFVANSFLLSNKGDKLLLRIRRHKRETGLLKAIS